MKYQAFYEPDIHSLPYAICPIVGGVKQDFVARSPTLHLAEDVAGLLNQGLECNRRAINIVQNIECNGDRIQQELTGALMRRVLQRQNFDRFRS